VLHFLFSPKKNSQVPVDMCVGEYLTFLLYFVHAGVTLAPDMDGYPAKGYVIAIRTVLFSQ
jgi:hypothetical protein